MSTGSRGTYILASQPAPTSDYAFFVEGFNTVSSPETIGMLWLASRSPYAGRYRAFEAYAQHVGVKLASNALLDLKAAGVAIETALILGSPAQSLMETVKSVAVNAVLDIYQRAMDHYHLAHNIPAHIRVRAAAFRHERGIEKAVRLLNAHRSNRDTVGETDRDHIRRARDAYAKGLELWEQTRSCDLAKANGLEPRAMHEEFDDAVFRALVEIRRRAEERKGDMKGKLGAALFTEIAEQSTSRGQAPADGVFNVAQRLDDEAGKSFRTIRLLAAMTCCPPLLSFHGYGTDKRISA